MFEPGSLVSYSKLVKLLAILAMTITIVTRLLVVPRNLLTSRAIVMIVIHIRITGVT